MPKIEKLLKRCQILNSELRLESINIIHYPRFDTFSPFRLEYIFICLHNAPFIFPTKMRFSL
jgi:hypothetical protein